MAGGGLRAGDWVRVLEQSRLPTLYHYARRGEIAQIYYIAGEFCAIRFFRGKVFDTTSIRLDQLDKIGGLERALFQDHLSKCEGLWNTK